MHLSLLNQWCSAFIVQFCGTLIVQFSVHLFCTLVVPLIKKGGGALLCKFVALSSYSGGVYCELSLLRRAGIRVW